MLPRIIPLGLCLYFISMSSSLSQGLKPFDYGQVQQQAIQAMQQAEQIRAMRLENQRRQLELEYMQQQQQLQQQQQQQQQQPQVSTESLQSNYDNEILSRFAIAAKYRKHRYEDFDKVITNENLQISLDMVALMAESRYAADIAYYLGKNLDESAAISRMALPQAGKAIFSIEKKLIQNDFKFE